MSQEDHPGEGVEINVTAESYDRQALLECDEYNGDDENQERFKEEDVSLTDFEAVYASVDITNDDKISPTKTTTGTNATSPNSTLDEEDGYEVPIDLYKMDYQKEEAETDESSVYEGDELEEGQTAFGTRTLICILCVLAILVPVVIMLQGGRSEEKDETAIGMNEHTQGGIVDDAPRMITVDNLPDYTQTALQDPNSAQSQAMDWLQTQSEYATWSDLQKMQRFALATLFLSTNGANWRSRAGWMSTKHECDWFASWQEASLTCPEGDGVYKSLVLADNALLGTLPPQIFLLTNLENLDLQFNSLTGSLPTQVGQHTSLESISLHRNNLVGTIPSQLGLVPSLKGVILNSNQLTGSIPTQMGHLSSLELLWLNGNALTGTIPTQLGRLENLRECWLNQNDLTGALPTQFGNLVGLEEIGLYENQLSGPIPAEWGRLTNLGGLYMGMNQLTGTIPTEMGRMTRLDQLFLHQNNLTGPIPTEMGQCNMLKRLYLGGNQLSDTIPTQIGNLQVINDLWLSANNFVGSIPSEMGQLKALQDLWMSENQFSQSLPSQLASIRNLRTLLLDQNQLTGSIPEDFSRLDVIELSLNDNYLTGTVPPELCQLDTLTFDCSTTLCGCSCNCDITSDYYPNQPTESPTDIFELRRRN